MLSIINFFLGIILIILLVRVYAVYVKENGLTWEILLISVAVIILFLFNVNDIVGNYRAFGWFKYPSVLYAITGGYPEYMISKFIALLTLLMIIRKELTSRS